MAFSTLLSTARILFLTTVLLGQATTAHDQQKPLSGGSSSDQQTPSTDWATRHMAEEHHISNFDPSAFFTLHDFDNNGLWAPDEILRTYGLEDESNKHVSAEKRNEVLKEIMKLMDRDMDRRINRREWLSFVASGGTLPDFGLGPGHHGDDEFEFHDENTKEEDLTHPEDIAHFKKHDKEADEESEQMKLDAMTIVERNIPAKFRRNF
ncbi:MAG: hypothetical protein M1816_004649 [Peltula sp. TS41687]|nr:MAG: hypothetical protein M1816_004649 [Peltula sp. TS41687]